MAMLSPDYTLASVHIVKQKIERIVFIVNIISTILFLAFYGYMIYSRMDVIANIVIYSTMGTILMVSFIFDIYFYRNTKITMNFLEKKKMASNKKLKKEIVNIIKVIVKIASLGYATYELIVIDSSPQKMLTLTLSYILFAVQIIIYLVADAIYRYYTYIYIGIFKDLDELTPLLHPIMKEEIREANRQLMSEKDKEMLKEIEAQRKIDIEVSKTNKDLKISMGNTGDKNTIDKLKRDAIESIVGAAPVAKTLRFIKNRKSKKNDNEGE